MTNQEKHMDRKSLGVIVGLAILCAAVYTPIVNNEFVAYDDGQYITENINIQYGLSLESIVWAFTSGYAANWHPLTWLTHIVDFQLYGKNPLGHHITNVILHVLNTVLLFVVFRRMTGNLWGSAFVAAVFGLHPLHVESVAWAAERKDVLSTLFWILTMWAYVRYVEQPRTARYVMLMGVFALGLMSKPMLVTLPFVLLLLDYWPLNRFETVHQEQAKGKSRRRSGWRAYKGIGIKLLKEKFPLFAMIVGSSAITFVAQREGGAVGSWEVLPLWVRTGNAFISYLRYIWKSIWPANLAVFYPHPGKSLPIWEIAIAVLLFAALFVLMFRTARSRRYIATGWLWYVGTLVPVIGLVQVGQQSLADRYMYVPMIGLSIIAAWGINDLTREWKFRTQLLSVAAGLAVLGMCVLTWQQVAYWRTSISLFDHAIAVTSDNWLAHNNLGFAYSREDKTALAVEHISEGLRLNPINAEAHNNLGVFFGKEGRIQEAMDHYRDALRINSKFVDAHNNLGVLLAEQGQVDSAISHYREALKINPRFVDARNNLGLTLAKEGKVDEAISQFNEVLRIDPNNEAAKANLATAIASRKSVEESLTKYQDAIRRNPNDAEAQFNLGYLLASQKRLPEAINYFSEAVRLRPSYAEARFNLGMALADQRRSAEAVTQFTEALRYKPIYPEANYNLAMSLVQIGNIPEAMNQFTRAIASNKDYAEARNNLGILLAQQGRTQEAMAQFSEAVRIRPDDPDAHYNLGLLLENQGRTAEAMEHYNSALKAKPDHVNARSGLDRLAKKQAQ